MEKWGNELLEKLRAKEKKNAGSDSSGEVKSINNRIYFYSAVNTKSILALNQELKKVTDMLLCQAIKLGNDPSPIYLHVNSYGGSIFAGIAGMDAIARNPVDVYSIVDGCAASAGTFLTVVAKKRFITKHSYVLIHQLSSGAWGKYEDFKDKMKNLDELMKMIRNIYLENTKISKDRLKKMLKHDLWFNSKVCLKHGLADEII